MTKKLKASTSVEVVLPPAAKRTKKPVPAALKKPALLATKKVIKNSPASKKPAAKSRSKSDKKLVVAKAAECFWTNDGQVLATLVELQSALQTMKAAVFKHHVTTKKNDFADWVLHILRDEACAKALRTKRTAKASSAEITPHLKKYSI